jgi:hypothetical protein
MGLANDYLDLEVAVAVAGAGAESSAHQGTKTVARAHWPSVAKS